MLTAGERTPRVSAYILARMQPPCVVVGDDVLRCSELPAKAKHDAAVIEGRAMLAINSHVLRMRPELVVLHASALSIAGRAAVIVGPTTSGKSTTAIALLMGDAQTLPLSDEFALIDKRTLEVEAFPRLFSIRLGARKLLGVSGLSLEWDAVDPVGVWSREWAASSKREAFFFIEGRARFASFRPLHLSEALFMAISNVLWPRETDLKKIRVVDEVLAGLEGAKLYALTLGPPRETAALIRSLVLGTAGSREDFGAERRCG